MAGYGNHNRLPGRRNVSITGKGLIGLEDAELDIFFPGEQTGSKFRRKPNMNILSTGELGQLIVVALDPHEMLLESIRETIKEENISNGVVISGIGTLKNLRMHYIQNTDFPPDDEITNIQRPLELVSVSGIIASGEPHLHVVVSCGRENTFAGHLEEGSEVAYLAELTILTTPNLQMARKLDRKRNIRLLRSQDREV